MHFCADELAAIGIAVGGGIALQYRFIVCKCKDAIAWVRCKCGR